jgi:alpha-tubulin suppressor-like RCC1 family protein
MDDGSVLCWGQANTVGDGTFNARNSPARVAGLDAKASVISAGALHTCALLETGAVKCWGIDAIGNGSAAPQPRATQVTGLTSGVTSLSSGGTFACAVLDGGAKCWGADMFGQEGCNKCGMRLSPGDVTGLAYDVKQVSCGFVHACALLNDGGVQCWGRNLSFQCGTGDNTTNEHDTPVLAVAFDAGTDALFAGYDITAAQTGDTFRCVGNNGSGMCGSAPAGPAKAARVVALDGGVTNFGVTAAGEHGCAVIDSAVLCWGADSKGELGDGMMGTQVLPVRALGINEPVIAVAAGGNHTCAITAAGGVLCWGDNTYGQLGNGSTGGLSLTPVAVH